MKKNIKKTLIEITSKMISEHRFEDLSIRKVSKEAGCTSGTIYLYFKNFNHLLLLSCLKYLKPYVDDINSIDIEFKNPIEENLYIWEIFCKRAFENPDIYYFIFFLSNEFFHHEDLKEYYEIKEYYTLFIDELKNFPSKYYKMILKLDLEERNKFLIEKMVKNGFVSPSHVTLLNLSQIFIFKGYLEKAKESTTFLSRKRFMRSCIRGLRKITEAYKKE